nr:hypothetical protein StreXyl84_06150 [Streptomyces sp. Xyl84]
MTVGKGQRMGVGVRGIPPRTVDYCLSRTAHGSTLSAAAHARVLSDLGHPDAEAFVRQALRGDMDRTDRTGTSYGIHIGAMAAALRLVRERPSAVTALLVGGSLACSRHSSIHASATYCGYRHSAEASEHGESGAQNPPGRGTHE